MPLTLTGRQRESYERAEREGIVEPARARRRHARRERPRADRPPQADLQRLSRQRALGKAGRPAPSGCETLAAEGHRALIFTQFVDERHGAGAITAGSGRARPLLYTGDLTPSRARRRRQAVPGAAGARRADPLPAAGAEGLNLQAASYVFHFDRWWNPARERQAEGRSHRLGQTRPVHVYTYICENTIEERIDAVLQDKQRLFDEVVDGVSLDLRALLDERELFGLFGLTPPG